MPRGVLTKEQKQKQREALLKHHEDGKNGLANTSANSIKEPRAINNVRRKISDLTSPSSEIIRKAVEGGLIPEMEVWTGTEEEREALLKVNKSAKFETVEVEKGMFVEVLIRYVPVSKSRVEIAKWVISQDIALKKAAEESKLRKIETAVKQKKAQEEGAVPKDNPQEQARRMAERGEHIKPLASLEEIDEFPEEDSFQDDDDY